MEQGFNPPQRTSSLGFICSSLRLYKIPSFCCLLITRFRYYWRQIRNASTSTLIIWRQIRKSMYLTSVLQWYLIWRHIIVAVRRTQTAIFFNFLAHKNEVYRKLKPLQEKVKYTFFSKLYYRVSREKIISKYQPSYRHVCLEKESLFDYKNGH